MKWEAVMVEAWAIRHNPTGGYLPDNRPYRRPSYEEPVVGAIPRLFKSKRHAQAALNRWLDGRWFVEGRWDSGFMDHEPADYVQELRYEPVEGRNADDMEVVRMMVMEFGEQTL